MIQTDTYIRLHTKGQSTIVASSAQGEPSELNRLTRGEQATLTLRFTSDILTVESGETHTVSAGTTEIYSQKDVKENGTVNVEEGGVLIITGQDNLAEMQVYERLAGNYASIESLNATQNFRQHLPDDADAESLVIGVEPSQSLQEKDINGIWGIVDGGTDQRPTTLTHDRYELQLRVLDDFSAYDSVSAVESDLET